MKRITYNVETGKTTYDDTEETEIPAEVVIEPTAEERLKALEDITLMLLLGGTL